MNEKTLTPEQIDDLCYASYQLLQTMSNIYGPDPAYEMFQKLEEVLGQEVKSNLFLKMLERSYSERNLWEGAINFTFVNGNCLNPIDMINCARKYGVDTAGHTLGLKAATDIIDAARYNGRGTIHFVTSEGCRNFTEELKRNNGRRCA